MSITLPIPAGGGWIVELAGCCCHYVRPQDHILHIARVCAATSMLAVCLCLTYAVVHVLCYHFWLNISPQSSRRLLHHTHNMLQLNTVEMITQHVYTCLCFIWIVCLYAWWFYEDIRWLSSVRAFDNSLHDIVVCVCCDYRRAISDYYKYLIGQHSWRNVHWVSSVYFVAYNRSLFKSPSISVNFPYMPIGTHSFVNVIIHYFLGTKTWNRQF